MIARRISPLFLSFSIFPKLKLKQKFQVLYNEVPSFIYLLKLTGRKTSTNIGVKITIPDEIKEWAFWLSSGILGEEKIPLCPWARKSILEGSVEFYVEEDPGELIPFPEGINVRIVSFEGRNHSDVIEIRNRCNKISKDWIYLDSHPDDEDIIGGIKTVFKNPLILIQPRKDLEAAREVLKRGNYYSYWNPSVLAEILSL